MRVIKFLFFVMLIMFIVFKNVDKPYAIQNKVLDYDYLSNEMIRFHVIANSNSDFDQMVKNKIKDEVLNYFKENENLNGNKFENLNTLYKNAYYVKKICRDVLEEFNLDQEVNIKIGKKYFEERIYEGYIVPEGTYDSFIIYIGDGLGKNFWSMLFPSIGFIHDYNENRKIDSIFKVVSNNSKKVEVFSNNSSNNNNIKISFKVFEVIKNVFKKIF